MKTGYTVNYLADKKIVSVITKGRVNFKSAEESAKEALKLAHQNNCSKFLLNHTETTEHGSVNTLHTSEAELRQFGFKNTDRIAIMVSNPAYNSTPQEPTSKSSHWSVLKYFDADDTNKAINWLLEIE